MSIESERRYHVICDACGEDFYDAESNSAMGARITAAVKGWRYLYRRQGRQGRNGVTQKITFDFCPVCEPKIPDES